MKKTVSRFTLLFVVLITLQWWRRGLPEWKDVALCLGVVLMLLLVSMAGDYYWNRRRRHSG